MPFNLKIIDSLQRILKHSRKSAVWSIWEVTRNGEFESALAGCELLREPHQWSLLTAIAAYYAEAGNAPAFEQVWQCVMKYAPHFDVREEVPNGALARCAVFRPASLVDIARCLPKRALDVFAILARRAADDAVAAALKAIEDAELGLKAEDELSRPLACAGRFELGMKCLPLIKQCITEPRGNDDPCIFEPEDRRDWTRWRMMQGLIRNRRFKEGLELLSTYETEQLKANDSMAIYLAMGEPLKALDILRKRTSAPWLLSVDELCVVLGEAGDLDAALEAAEAAERLVENGYGAECIRTSCKFAIKAGHAASVSAVLERINPKRVRTKIAEMLLLAKHTAEPKSLRGRAALWVEGNSSTMPVVISKISSLLAEAPTKDRVFLLTTLMKAQAKGGFSAEIAHTIEQARTALQKIQTRTARIEAAQELAATVVAIGRPHDGLQLLDSTAGALEMGDKDEVRELVHGFVEACDAQDATHLLHQLSASELAEADYGIFIEEALTWQGAQSDDVNKLIARAKKNNDFSTMIDMLRAEERFAEAAVVFRHAPENQKCHWANLAGAVADYGQFQIALDILNSAHVPIPGEHAPNTPAPDLLKAYVFRAAYGLPGAGIENLFHAVDAALGKHDLR